jgi:hypothetical protein
VDPAPARRFAPRPSESQNHCRIRIQSTVHCGKKDMMRKGLLASLASLGLVTSFGLATAAFQGNAATGAPAARGAAALKDRFVGTWKLVGTEQRNAKGEIIPPVNGNQAQVGYIIYDPAGYVAVSIMPAGRAKYAGAQPTDDEVRKALAGYTAYFGTFTINEAETTVTHHLEGSVNARMTPDQKRGYAFTQNRLTLKPPAAANGNQSSLTWERVPDLQNPTPEQRNFFGFWKLISNERHNEKGEVLSSNPGQTGYIIYTRAGFMMVHMVQPNRKPYAANQPTPEEARQNLRSYTNYFGPFYVHQADGYVVHDQVGSLGVGRIGPSPQQRFYQFSGQRLLLHPPPTFTPDNQTTQGTITWERVGSASATR